MWIHILVLLTAMLWYIRGTCHLFSQEVHFQLLNLKLNCSGLIKKEIKSTEINCLWNRFKLCKNYRPLTSSREGKIWRNY